VTPQPASNFSNQTRYWYGPRWANPGAAGSAAHLSRSDRPANCGNALWPGICGKDGLHGVALDEPRHAGRLLALCSKNQEDEETFAAQPEAPLRICDFAERRAD
jgi:hypothetical protein